MTTWKDKEKFVNINSSLNFVTSVPSSGKERTVIKKRKEEENEKQLLYLT